MSIKGKPTPQPYHHKLADQFCQKCNSVFDPLHTMDWIKWKVEIVRWWPQLPAADVEPVAVVMEQRYFKGFV